jgi:hypothetical protein
MNLKVPHFVRSSMAVSVEMHHLGSVPAVRSEISAIIEHALADRPGALAICPQAVN